MGGEGVGRSGGVEGGEAEVGMDCMREELNTCNLPISSPLL